MIKHLKSIAPKMILIVQMLLELTVLMNVCWNQGHSLH